MESRSRCVGTPRSIPNQKTKLAWRLSSLDQDILYFPLQPSANPWSKLSPWLADGRRFLFRPVLSPSAGISSDMRAFFIVAFFLRHWWRLLPNSSPSSASTHCYWRSFYNVFGVSRKVRLGMKVGRSYWHIQVYLLLFKLDCRPQCHWLWFQFCSSPCEARWANRAGFEEVMESCVAAPPRDWTSHFRRWTDIVCLYPVDVQLGRSERLFNICRGL